MRVTLWALNQQKEMDHAYIADEIACTLFLCLGNDLRRRLGLHINQRVDQLLNNLGTLVRSSLFDLLEFHFSFLIRILLSLLITA